MKQMISKTIDRFFHDMAIAELRIEQSRHASSRLTHNDMMYLNIIEANSGKYTISALADLLNISRPSVTNKINELEQLGYITKKQDASDKRMYYLHFNAELTDGTYHYEQYYALSDKIMDDILATHSEADIQTFCTMLDEIGRLYLDKTNHA